MSFKHLTIGAAVSAALLVPAPAASAQSARSGYSEPAGSIQQQIGRDDPSAKADATDRSGALPFTGLDIALIGGVGGMLLAAGLAGRRLLDAPSR